MDKLELITQDVYNEFGNRRMLTGEEIKEKLSEIYSKHGAYFYPSIKALSEFGYILKRKKIDGKFMYLIKKSTN